VTKGSAKWSAVREIARHIQATVPSLLNRRRSDFNCAFQDSPSWDERAAEAVAMLRTHISSTRQPAAALVIGDFGAGNERLRGVLEHELQQPIEYHAFDLAPQRPTTVRIDLATDTPPGSFDVVFCLGVLEYLRDPIELLSRIASISRLIVVSYVVADGAERLSTRQRRARGWLSDLTIAEMDRELMRLGLRSRAVGNVNRDRTRIWLIESAGGDAAGEAAGP